MLPSAAACRRRRPGRSSSCRRGRTSVTAPATAIEVVVDVEAVPAHAAGQLDVLADGDGVERIAAARVGRAVGARAAADDRSRRTGRADSGRYRSASGAVGPMRASSPTSRARLDAAWPSRDRTRAGRTRAVRLVWFGEDVVGHVARLELAVEVRAGVDRTKRGAVMTESRTLLAPPRQVAQRCVAAPRSCSTSAGGQVGVGLLVVAGRRARRSSLVDRRRAVGVGRQSGLVLAGTQGMP